MLEGLPLELIEGDSSVQVCIRGKVVVSGQYKGLILSPLYEYRLGGCQVEIQVHIIS